MQRAKIKFCEADPTFTFKNHHWTCELRHLSFWLVSPESFFLHIQPKAESFDNKKWAVSNWLTCFCFMLISKHVKKEFNTKINPFTDQMSDLRFPATFFSTLTVCTVRGHWIQGRKMNELFRSSYFTLQGFFFTSIQWLNVWFCRALSGLHIFLNTAVFSFNRHEADIVHFSLSLSLSSSHSQFYGFLHFK